MSSINTSGIKRLYIITRVGVALVVVMSIIISIVLYRDNIRLRGLLSAQQFGVLSSDARRLIVSDLQSSDLARMRPWESYFSHTLDLETNLEGRVPDLGVLLQLYRSREQPARSNYFGDLVSALGVRQQSMGLKRKDLVGYLGNPDETQDVAEGQILEYRFSWYGRDAIALIRATNDTVLAVGFNVVSDLKLQSK